jgi:hypothetical protein
MATVFQSGFNFERTLRHNLISQVANSIAMSCYGDINDVTETGAHILKALRKIDVDYNVSDFFPSAFHVQQEIGLAHLASY